MASGAGPLQWRLMDVSSSPAVPPARTYATLISYGNNLYLFGGYGESKGRFNDVYEYSTTSRQWRLVPCSGDLPKPMYLHSAVQHGTAMLTFGGNNGKESNDLYSFDLRNFVWSRAPQPGMLAPASAHPPAARYGHASCVYGNGQLLIVGGCKSNNSYYRDAHVMSLDTRQWRRLEDLPLDLAYHSLFTYEQRAYLFGGYNGKSYVQHVYALDSLTGKWNVMGVSGQQPPPMCGAATVIRGADLFVFGGYTEKGHTNELYRLNMRTAVWTLLPTANKPLSRAYLQAAVVGDACYIFGGYDGNTCVGDFRSVLLPPAAPAPFPSAGGGGGHGQGYSGFIQRNPFADGVGLFQLSVPQQVDTLLQSYTGSSDSMSRQQLQQMMAHLGSAIRALPARRLSGSSSSTATSGGGGDSQYPFDTSRIGSLVDLGFSRERVLAVMTRMHAAGQNTRNIELVADWCIRDSADAEPTPAPSAAAASSATPQSNPGLDRQLSEREVLKKKVEQLLESQEEARTCKVCFDAPIDVALQPCGHLAVCATCAESLATRQGPCPICQTHINGKLKVYWT